MALEDSEDTGTPVDDTEASDSAFMGESNTPGVPDTPTNADPNTVLVKDTSESPSEKKPIDSSYLLNFEAQSILENAPTLQIGKDLLKETYNAKSWDDPKAAQTIVSNYSDDLRHRFKDNGLYSNEELGAGVAPISLKEITGKGATPEEENLDKVNTWEAKNKELISTSDHADILINKGKALKSIEEAASGLRRDLRTDSRGVFSNAIQDTAFRILEGAAAGPAKALGLESYTKGLKERTDPSYDDDFGSAAAGGLGFMGGAFTAALGGPAGEYTYLATQGLSAIKNKYDESKTTTGDTTKALEAGAIEVPAQALQLLPAGKLLARPAERMLGSILGREAAPIAARAGSKLSQVAKDAALLTGGQVAGTITSNVATGVGTDTPIKYGRGVRDTAILGALFGAGLGGLNVALDPSIKVDPTIQNGGTPPPKPVSVIGAHVDPVASEVYKVTKASENLLGEGAPPAGSFTTKDGSIYSIGPEGAVFRTKTSTEEVSTPMDKTFIVEKPVAAKLAALRDYPMPDGKPVQITTDGTNLLLQSEHLNPDLSVSDTPTGLKVVPVPLLDTTEKGSHAVGVNKPRTIEGNKVEYRSHISQEIASVSPVEPATGPSSTVGAMYIGSPFKEGTVGKRIQNSPAVDEQIKNITAANANYYETTPHGATEAKVGDFVEANGLAGSVSHFLTLDMEAASAANTGLGIHLFRTYNNAAIAAKKAGDTKGFNENAQVAAMIANKMDSRGSILGQGVEAHKLGVDLFPEMKIAALKQDITDSALKEVASEEGVSHEDLKTTPEEIQRHSDLIKGMHDEAQKNADLVNTPLENDIKAHEEEAKAIEEAAKTRTEKEYQDLQNQHKAATDRIKELEEKGKKKAKAVNDANSTKEKHLKKLETEGQKRAEEAHTKDIANKEKVIEKVKSQGKDTSKAEEGLAKDKARVLKPEDGLNTEERKTLQELRRHAAKPIEPPKTPEDVLTESEKKEIQNLKDLTAKTKDKVSQKPTETLKPAEKVKIDKLKKLAEEKKSKVREASKDSLTPEQKAKIAELTKAKKKLEDRQARVEKKLRDKLSKFTEADQESLIKLYKVRDKLKEGESNRGRVDEQIEKIESKIAKVTGTPRTPNKRALNRFFTQYVTNLFSGLGTQIGNFKGNILQFLSNPAAYVITGHPTLALEFFKGAIGNIKEGWLDAVNALVHGESRMRHGGKYGGENDPVKTGYPVLRYTGVVLRALKAADALFFHPARGAHSRLWAYEDALASKLKPGTDAFNVHMSELLHNTKADYSEALTEANAQADALREAGIELKPYQIRSSAWEIMEGKRPDLMRQETTRFAKESTFTEPPKGSVGYLTNLVHAIANFPIPLGNGRVVTPLKYGLPVIDVGGNILSSYLGYTPFGGFRALFKRDFTPTENFKVKWNDEPKHQLQRILEVGKFMLGTIGTGILYGLVREHQDNKDPYIALHGPGPKDPGQNALWIKEGNRPWTIKVGEHVGTFIDTPLALNLGALGAYLDNERYNKSFGKKSSADKLVLAVLGSAQSYVNNTYLQSLANLLNMVMNPSAKAATSMLGNITHGMAVPMSGALKNIANIVDNPIDTKGGELWASFISGTPWVERLGTRPALGAFGEIVERPAEEKMLGLNRLFTSRSADPRYLWLTQNGYTIPDAAGPSVELSGKQWEAANKRREKNLGPEFAGQLSHEELYALIEKGGPRVGSVVNQFKSQHGNSAYRESIQEELNKTVSKVWSEEKDRMFNHP